MTCASHQLRRRIEVSLAVAKPAARVAAGARAKPAARTKARATSREVAKLEHEQRHQ